jgi:hypothetical protein
VKRGTHGVYPRALPSRERVATTARMSDVLVTSPPGTALMARPFSNNSRCPQCGNGHEVRIHYDPSALRTTSDGAVCVAGMLGESSGGHFHRHCRCGAEWIEVGCSTAPITPSSRHQR